VKIWHPRGGHTKDRRVVDEHDIEKKKNIAQLANRTGVMLQLFMREMISLEHKSYIGDKTRNTAKEDHGCFEGSLTVCIRAVRHLEQSQACFR